MTDQLKTALSLARSVLYLPASNARAMEKARGLDCDMVIVDLEDAVRDEDKPAARLAAVAGLAEAWKADVVAVRVNGPGTQWHQADVEALRDARPAVIVVPKVESADAANAVAGAVGAPVLAMIETPLGVYSARDIAAAEGVAGLIAGTNDLAAELGLPPGGDRTGLALSLQAMVLAARAAGGVAFDGVYNRLDDPEGLARECREGRTLGFTGKTLIHPNQIGPCNSAFGPSDEEIDDARALIEAASGGAERFRGRMVEAMHVASARRLLARARA